MLTGWELLMSTNRFTDCLPEHTDEFLANGLGAHYGSG